MSPRGVAEQQEHHHLRAQPFPGAVEPRVVRGPEQGVVEVDIVARHLLAGDSLARSGLKKRENRLKGRQVGRGGVAAGLLHRQSLQRGAQGVDLGDVLAGDGGDGGTAMRLVDDEAFLLELEERLADRAAAHVQHPREVVLDQPRTGGEAPGEDRLADRVDDVVHQHAPAARRGKRVLEAVLHRSCLQSTSHAAKRLDTGPRRPGETSCGS